MPSGIFFRKHLWRSVDDIIASPTIEWTIGYAAYAILKHFLFGRGTSSTQAAHPLTQRSKYSLKVLLNVSFFAPTL